MKKIMLVLLLFPYLSFSQSYSEVVQADGKIANDLYVAAREWFALTFNSANDVLQMEDPQAGKLIGKGFTSVNESFVVGKGLAAVPVTLDWEADFTLKIEVREGRYKYTLSDVLIKSFNQYTGATSVPFSNYKAQQEYYEKGSDPEWLKQNPQGGIKMGKAMAKTTAQTNKAMVAMILKVENQLEGIIENLKAAMKTESSTSDDW